MLKKECGFVRAVSFPPIHLLLLHSRSLLGILFINLHTLGLQEDNQQHITYGSLKKTYLIYS